MEGRHLAGLFRCLYATPEPATENGTTKANYSPLRTARDMRSLKDFSPSVGALLLMSHSQNVPAPLQKRFMDLYRRGDYQQAKKDALSLTRRFPQDAFGWKALGNSQLYLGDVAAATASLERAKALTPDDPLVLMALSRAYFSQGQKQQALELQRLGLELDDQAAQAHFNMATMLYNSGDYDLAEESLVEAEKAGHPAAEILTIRITIASERFRFREGLEMLEKLQSLQPENPEVLNTLGNYHKDMADFESARHYYGEALRLSQQYYTAYSNDLINDHYDPAASATDILEKSRAWRDRFKPDTQFSHDGKDLTLSRNLKVGLLSSNFRSHPVGWMSSSALANLPSDIELYAYTDNDSHDPIAEKIKQVCHWIPCYHMDHQQLADRIFADDIDILIDMAGHGAQSRLPVIDMKPAPIIVKWVGSQISSMGIEAFDYFLSDSHETPPGVDHLYTEKLIRLPNDYICYTPPAYTPAITSLPAISNGYVTFGCFNNPAKVNDVLLAEWAKVMHRVSGSRLFMKGGQYSSHRVCERVISTLERHGINRDRVTLEGPSDHKELLESYNRVDIALDTWPYSGGLTTCEALLMGVPVVTHVGPTFAGRHSATHLSNTGMPELVTDSWETFRERVIELASDLPSLAVIRAALRTYLEHSPICDAPKFGRHLRKALRAVWQRYCESAKPAALTFDGHGRAYFEDRDGPVEVPRPPTLETDNGFGWPLEEPIIAIDNGGQLLNDKNVEKLLRDERLELIVFDPSGAAAHHPMSRAERVHYYAGHGLGTGSPATLFTPSPNLPSSLHGDSRSEQQAQVATKPTAFDTLALDSIEGLPALDWLLLDDASDAADILSHGSQSLAAALLIQVKIAFQPTHERQPDLGEVQRWAREHGFRLYHLHDQQHRSALLMDEIPADAIASELWSAQALLLPDQTRMTSLSDSQRIKLAFLLHVIYGFKDASGSLLKQVNYSLANSYLVNHVWVQPPACNIPTPLQVETAEFGDSRIAVVDKLKRSLSGKTVCFVDTGNAANHGLIRSGLYNIYRILETGGCKVRWLASNEATPKTLIEIAASRTHVMLGGNRFYDTSISASGYGKSNLFQTFECPIIGTISDHPYADFMLDRVQNAFSKGLFLARGSLGEELSFLRPDLQFINRERLESASQEYPGCERPHHQRDIDILVPMNFAYAVQAEENHDQLLETAKNYGANYVRLVEAVMERFSDFSQSLLSIFREIYQKIFGYSWSVEFPWRPEDHKLIHLLGQIDNVIRGNKRREALRFLANTQTDINIVVLASERERSLIESCVGHNITAHWQFIGAQPFDQLKGLYARARYVLSVFPTYHDLLHERLRTAGAAGCAVISNINQRTQELLVDGENILIYEGKTIDEIYNKNPEVSESVGLALRECLQESLISTDTAINKTLKSYADYLSNF